MTAQKSKWWREKLNRSFVFFIALFLHVLVLTMVATLIIFEPDIISSPNFKIVYVRPSTPPPPSPPMTPGTVVAPTMSVPLSTSPIAIHNTSVNVSIPLSDLGALDDTSASSLMKTSVIEPPQKNNLPARLSEIWKTELLWRSRENILNSGSDVRNVVAKFPVYLAQYADGDWNCNNYVDKTGAITGGCLPNLVYQIGLWSHGNLKGQEVKTIAIDSPELLNDRPPYILFTGHRDFKLTDAEIENLQKYLQIGGAIWGDNAFAGDGSRFDVAFHREMKRVLPDVDMNFEPLPMTHDIFTHSWFQIDKIPAGMNYRADPVQIINLDGKLAVIYTPNDYSDMMTMVLLAGADPPQLDKQSLGPWAPTPDHPLFTPNGFLGSSRYFFRNYAPDSAQDSYKLSINILAHLLIRFDKDLQLAP